MGFLIEYQAIKGLYLVQSRDQDKFSQSKLLIPVANGSTRVMSMTTPCIAHDVIKGTSVNVTFQVFYVISVTLTKLSTNYSSLGSIIDHINRLL